MSKHGGGLLPLLLALVIEISEQQSGSGNGSGNGSGSGSGMGGSQQSETATPDIQEVIGNNCTNNFECIYTSQLGCEFGRCSCRFQFGYTGDRCLEKTSLTYSSIFTTAFSILLLFGLTIIGWMMMKAYVLGKFGTDSESGSSGTSPGGLFSFRSGASRGCLFSFRPLAVFRKIQHNTKSKAIIFAFMNNLPLLIICCYRLSYSLHQENFIFIFKRYLHPFRFLMQNQVQLQVGLAWIEIAVQCNQKLQFLKKHLKKLRIFLNMFAFLLVVFSVVLMAVTSQDFTNYVFLLLYVMIFIGTLALSIGAIWLKNVMTNDLVLSPDLIAEKRAIATAAKRFVGSFGLQLVSSFFFPRAKAELNGWTLLVSQLFNVLSLISYQLSLYSYLDHRRRKVFGGRPFRIKITRKKSQRKVHCTDSAENEGSEAIQR